MLYAIYIQIYIYIICYTPNFIIYTPNYIYNLPIIHTLYMCIYVCVCACIYVYIYMYTFLYPRVLFKIFNNLKDPHPLIKTELLGISHVFCSRERLKWLFQFTLRNWSFPFNQVILLYPFQSFVFSNHYHFLPLATLPRIWEALSECLFLYLLPAFLKILFYLLIYFWSSLCLNPHLLLEMIRLGS